MASADRVTLYGLMVKPIQRFPQFILLLQVWAGGSCTHLPLHPIFLQPGCFAKHFSKGHVFGLASWDHPKDHLPSFDFGGAASASNCSISNRSHVGFFFGVSFVPHPRTC